MEYILNINEVSLRDINLVGGKINVSNDFPDFAQFLVEEGIDSISVTPDSLLKTLKALEIQG